jgi:NAD(P)-dependent dehydrogenase (short-subunit alcohol dehydrogenase family)
VGVLDGKVALVTGCGREKGLGRGIARALATAGADVAVSDVKPEGTRNENEIPHERAEWRGLASVVAEIEHAGRRAFPLVGDVGRKADAERMVAEAIEKLGQVDILVNNAGAPQGADRGWTWEVPEEAFDEQLRVNTKGVFLMCAPVVRHFLARGAQGRIINIASGAGKRASPKSAAYAASKFAVIGLTQSLAQELAPRGITVNAVCPGAVDTAREAARQGRHAAQAGPDVKAPSFVMPVGRIGTPDDIARTVVFLADPAASFITGQSISVDGGLMM